jgi:hypothetical protein
VREGPCGSGALDAQSGHLLVRFAACTRASGRALVHGGECAHVHLTCLNLLLQVIDIRQRIIHYFDSMLHRNENGMHMLLLVVECSKIITCLRRDYLCAEHRVKKNNAELNVDTWDIRFEEVRM